MAEARPAVSIVVPMHNEAATAEALVTRIRAVMEPAGRTFEIVLVDDGSRDDTAATIRRLEAADARIQVYQLTRKFGQSAAMACGLFAARGDAIVTLDADLQNPPEEIPKLLAALDGASIASGCRATRYEGFMRWLASRGLHWLACCVTGVWIRDFGGNFKAYQRHVIDRTRAVWAPPKHFFTTALQLGFPVTEVTVRHDPRRVGQSRYTLATALWINIGFVTAHTRLPLAALTAAGAVAIALGTTFTCWWAGGPRWLASGFLTLLAAGTLACALGAIGLYLGRIHQRASGGLPVFVVQEGPRGTWSCGTGTAD